MYGRKAKVERTNVLFRAIRAVVYGHESRRINAPPCVQPRLCALKQIGNLPSIRGSPITVVPTFWLTDVLMVNTSCLFPDPLSREI